MIISRFPGDSSKIGDIPFNEVFQYTGSALYFDDGEGNWRIKFLSSGILTVAQEVDIDIFAVGGGGNGSSGVRASSVLTTSYSSGAGGGGGYTKTEAGIKLKKGASYTITVGAARGKSSFADQDGVSICEAAGGKNAVNTNIMVRNGGAGGSGGGPGVYIQGGTKGKPGSDGGSGTDSVYSKTTYGTGGTGQGTTTREFGESTGDLYAGGGGGGFAKSQTRIAGASGGGGGGATKKTAAENGGENTGGGGGGGGIYDSTITADIYYTAGGTGGSGIVIIRNAHVITS